jgi:hypothetical protein
MSPEAPQNSSPAPRARRAGLRRFLWPLVLTGVAGALVAALVVWLVCEHSERSHRFHAVTKGVLYRAEQPEADDLRQGLARRRITTVVNLRYPWEDPAAWNQEKQVCDELREDGLDPHQHARPLR